MDIDGGAEMSVESEMYGFNPLMYHRFGFKIGSGANSCLLATPSDSSLSTGETEPSSSPRHFPNSFDYHNTSSSLTSPSSGFGSPGGSSCCSLEQTSEWARYVQQSINIDLEGMTRELFGSLLRRRDVDSIRQDFIRNGIDSSIGEMPRMHVVGVCGQKKSQAPVAPLPPSKWPLVSVENQRTVSVPSAGEDEKQDAVVSKPETKASMRRRKLQKENEDYCVFCYNNGEAKDTYMSHACRDEDGLVECPHLRRYVCPYCKATDRQAHTKKYCPKKPIITPVDLERMVVEGTTSRNGYNKENMQDAPSKYYHLRQGKRSLRF
ncbi:uncharacterized protein LOC129738880 [Uranotaenia lowii]|uniref:uncharacterized protein LOC129738880 n=1 Tax=Uranotaenia lowii TaxID=190385 RepID=UPI002479DB89|nr:uncharacterized protein LOC129738880 [Uranotaenia lowii]